MQQTRNARWMPVRRGAGLGSHHGSMEPLTVLVIAGVTLVASGFAVSALPVQRCDECEHCRRLKLEREHEQRRLRAEYARRWGIRREDADSPPFRDDDR